MQQRAEKAHTNYEDERSLNRVREKAGGEEKEENGEREAEEG